MNQSKTEQALRISSLIKKYLKDELNENERQELDQWLAEHPKDRNDLQQLLTQKLNDHDKVFATEQPYAELISRIREGNHSMLPITKRGTPWYQFAAAAAVILVVTVGLLIFKRQNSTTITSKLSVVQAKKGVELKLSNGKIINLDMQATGLISSGSQAIITKKEGEVLSYEATAQELESEIDNTLNTLSIPRGKQYQLILPDGSKVWLNAQSTISFPSSFNKKERIIELSGEAYFEVNHVEAWPFKVKTQDQEVKVLGTKFNINAYADEIQTTTTLVSGSVSVSDQSNTQLLKPNQLAIKLNGKSGFTITAADLNETLAWKNGKLSFRDEKIENITQTLARTFDVDFEIDERMKGQHFRGTFAINNGLSNALRSLEQTGAIHFKTEGRRIIVMP